MQTLTLNTQIANVQSTQTIANQNEVINQESFQVFVRIRPLNTKQQQSHNIHKKGSCIKVQTDQANQTIENSKSTKSYSFDRVFEDSASTNDIFDYTVRPTIDNILNGFNSTVFAYGMTGAGKSFTMFGNIYHPDSQNNSPGLISLTINEIINRIRESEMHFEYNLKVSYLEIYNEQVRDLLTEKSEQLMLIEDPIKGVIVPDLTEHEIFQQRDILQLIIEGNSRRIMASTSANTFSSRSHAIIQITVEKQARNHQITVGANNPAAQSPTNSGNNNFFSLNSNSNFNSSNPYTNSNQISIPSQAANQVFCSKISLVDLAGSERASVTENRGLRMTEGANINKSLLALGNCINLLSDANKKGSFVPYRDSKLTRLLQDSLGGNTKTIMVACVSPSLSALEETNNTLQYASRARKIQKKVSQNIKQGDIHASQYKDLIEALKGEINNLKQQLREKDDLLAANLTSNSVLMNPNISNNNSANYGQGFAFPNSYNSSSSSSQLLGNNHNNQMGFTGDSGKNQVIFNYQNTGSTMMSTTPSTNDLQIIGNKGGLKGFEDEMIQRSSGSDSTDVNKARMSISSNIDQVGQKLFKNLEENWELVQSLKEITELNRENRIELGEKRGFLEINQSCSQTLEEIMELQKVIDNNEMIKIEIQQKLDLNLKEKTRIQLLLQDAGRTGSWKNLEHQCRALRKEQLELEEQNYEYQIKADDLEQQKLEKEKRLSEMEKIMLEMRREMAEKDEMLEKQNQQLENLMERLNGGTEQNPYSSSLNNFRILDSKSNLFDNCNEPNQNNNNNNANKKNFYKAPLQTFHPQPMKRSNLQDCSTQNNFINQGTYNQAILQQKGAFSSINALIPATTAVQSEKPSGIKSKFLNKKGSIGTNTQNPQSNLFICNNNNNANNNNNHNINKANVNASRGASASHHTNRVNSTIKNSTLISNNLKPHQNNHMSTMGKGNQVQLGEKGSEIFDLKNYSQKINKVDFGNLDSQRNSNLFGQNPAQFRNFSMPKYNIETNYDHKNQHPNFGNPDNQIQPSTTLAQNLSEVNLINHENFTSIMNPQTKFNVNISNLSIPASPREESFQSKIEDIISKIDFKAAENLQNRAHKVSLGGGSFSINDQKKFQSSSIISELNSLKNKIGFPKGGGDISHNASNMSNNGANFNAPPENSQTEISLDQALSKITITPKPTSVIDKENFNYQHLTSLQDDGIITHQTTPNFTAEQYTILQERKDSFHNIIQQVHPQQANQNYNMGNPSHHNGADFSPVSPSITKTNHNQSVSSVIGRGGAAKNGQAIEPGCEFTSLGEARERMRNFKLRVNNIHFQVLIENDQSPINSELRKIYEEIMDEYNINKYHLSDNEVQQLTELSNIFEPTNISGGGGVGGNGSGATNHARHNNSQVDFQNLFESVKSREHFEENFATSILSEEMDLGKKIDQIAFVSNPNLKSFNNNQNILQQFYNGSKEIMMTNTDSHMSDILDENENSSSHFDSKQKFQVGSNQNHLLQQPYLTQQSQFKTQNAITRGVFSSINNNYADSVSKAISTQGSGSSLSSKVPSTVGNLNMGKLHLKENSDQIESYGNKSPLPSSSRSNKSCQGTYQELNNWNYGAINEIEYMQNNRNQCNNNNQVESQILLQNNFQLHTQNF